MSLTATQIAQAAYNAGFRGQALQWMTQIAMRESGGNPGAYNGNVKTGDNSWGLWQINTLGSNGPGIRRILQSLGHSGDFQDLTNPAINAQVAYKLSSGGTNFEPWRSHSPGWEGPQGFLTNTQQYAAQASQAAVQVQMGKASQTTNFVTMAKNAMGNTSGVFGSLVGWLNQQIGKPYKFGSVGPDTFDCSGLVTAAYKQLGIDLPALTFSQKEYGAPVSFDKMQPGDLILKHGSQGDFGHVGIYIGGGQVIDAPHTGATVRVTSVDNWSDAQAVRRIVDAQGRVITGAGLTPKFSGSFSTVQFSQAAMDPNFDLTAQGDPMSQGSTDTGTDQQFRSALNLTRQPFDLPGFGKTVTLPSDRTLADSIV